MPRWQRIYLAACAGVIGFCLAYVICDFAALPRLWYFPRERAWRFAERVSSPLPMAYYGMWLWGMGGAAVAGAGAWVGTGLAKVESPRRWLHLAGGWAITAVCFASGYFLWGLWPF